MSALPDIPGYKIQRLLARGGTANVYLAEQLSLGRDVALKVLNKQLANKQFTERFLREGKLVASLEHPSVITIFDIAVSSGGYHYIAMEYINGGDLEQRIARWRMEPDEAMDVIHQVASTLVYVHSQGVIHRDIKPGNILFRDDGSLILTDFGIAKLVDEDMKLTLTGTTVGSPAYSSPEQVQGQELDGRTDIYSLGVMLVEMLIGSNPFRAAVYTSTSLNHIQMAIPKLAGKHKRYQSLLNLMLAKNADNRFADIQCLLSYLDSPPSRLALILSEWKQQFSLGRPAWAAISIVILLSVFLGNKYQQRSAVIDDLLEHAQSKMANDHRTAPAGDNALFYYDKILTIEQDNESAVAGKAQLLEFFLEHAQQAYNRKRLMKPAKTNAHYYYQQALMVEADNKQALQGIEQLTLRYIELGTLALNNDRLMRPTRNNAYYYFNQALKIDSNNREAIAGINHLVERYIEMATTAKKDFRLLTPKGRSAIDYYQRALTIQPHSRAAKKGIEEIANHYAMLATAARDRGQKKKMRLYINRGLTVDPYNTKLINLKAEAERKTMFLSQILR